MILQTLSENAIKHGLKRENCLGIIRIEARRKEGFAVISVEDNGIGRVAAAVNLRNSTGKGLKIVEEQLEMYRKAYNKACFLDVIDLYDASGKACGTRFEMNVGT
jgi:LytS/YehU family sensor histidine kinase